MRRCPLIRVWRGENDKFAGNKINSPREHRATVGNQLAQAVHHPAEQRGAPLPCAIATICRYELLDDRTAGTCAESNRSSDEMERAFSSKRFKQARRPVGPIQEFRHRDEGKARRASAEKTIQEMEASARQLARQSGQAATLRFNPFTLGSARYGMAR